MPGLLWPLLVPGESPALFAFAEELAGEALGTFFLTYAFAAPNRSGPHGISARAGDPPRAPASSHVHTRRVGDGAPGGLRHLADAPLRYCEPLRGPMLAICM